MSLPRAWARAGAVAAPLLLCAVLAQAQGPPPRATVVRTPAPPALDGILDEPFWARSQPATGFWDNFPGDSTRSAYQTELRFASDEAHLYVAATCYAPGRDYVITSLKRDYRAGGNDNITFVFDPFGTGRNALVFGMNPLGVTREALISNGGVDPGDFQEAWDNKWRGESRIYDDRWVCEVAIPLRSLRYPADSLRWGFNAYRFDTQSNSRSTWNRIPRNQMIMSLAFMGELAWEQPPAKAGGAVTLIPFAAGGASRDFEGAPSGNTELAGGLGGDAKVAVSSGLNLDLTVNPDFSQVEVDRQVINLTRFELRFPERRQFFLENADLFGSFGFDRINPFFSRRIGITRDTATGAAISNPIFYGARLSGQLNDRWRLGLLNMQADDNRANGLPSYNYTVAALQRQVGTRSSVGLVAVNKQNFTGFSDSSRANLDYNRVVGADFNLATPNDLWTGKTFVHASFNPAVDADGLLAEAPAPEASGTDLNLTHGFLLTYQRRAFDVSYDHSYIADGYRAEVGFVPRTDLFTLSPEVNFRFFPTRGPVVNHGPSAEARFFFDAALATYTDQRSGIGYNVSFTNTSRLTADARYTYIRLADDFDPTRTDATPLPAGTDYDYLNLRLEYRSDRRRPFSYSAELTGGQFFNGSRYGVEARASYRFQPFGSVSLRTAYSYVDLPRPYASTGIFLVGPRVDLTFTKSLFLTGVVQYNDQLDNFNTNVRFQWRYAPVSDLFIVYTDNYDTLLGTTRNRALVAKLSYWLNL